MASEKVIEIPSAGLRKHLQVSLKFAELFFKHISYSKFVLNEICTLFLKLT